MSNFHLYIFAGICLDWGWHYFSAWPLPGMLKTHCMLVTVVNQVISIYQPCRRHLQNKYLRVNNYPIWIKYCVLLYVKLILKLVFYIISIYNLYVNMLISNLKLYVFLELSSYFLGNWLVLEKEVVI